MQKLIFQSSMITLKANEAFIIVLGRTQILKYYCRSHQLSFHISTAINGYGEQHNSFKTPRGWHYIRAIIGKNDPTHIYYKNRRPTLYHNDISGRILWLCGLEPCINHHPKMHSMLRYIYIHGTAKSYKKSPTVKR